MLKLISDYGDTVDMKIIGPDGVSLHPAKIAINFEINSLITAVLEFPDGTIKEFEGVILGEGPK